MFPNLHLHGLTLVPETVVSIFSFRYIGNKTKEVNQRLHSIKPPHRIPRVPRNVEQGPGWKGKLVK